MTTIYRSFQLVAYGLKGAWIVLAPGGKCLGQFSNIHKARLAVDVEHDIEVSRVAEGDHISRY